MNVDDIAKIAVEAAHKDCKERGCVPLPRPEGTPHMICVKCAERAVVEGQVRTLILMTEQVMQASERDPAEIVEEAKQSIEQSLAVIKKALGS